MVHLGSDHSVEDRPASAVVSGADKFGNDVSRGESPCDAGAQGPKGQDYGKAVRVPDSQSVAFRLRLLVLYDVGFKYFSKLTPLGPIENSVGREALGCSIRHVKSMVRVVMDKQSLPTEREQPLDFL